MQELEISSSLHFSVLAEEDLPNSLVISQVESFGGVNGGIASVSRRRHRTRLHCCFRLSMALAGREPARRRQERLVVQELREVGADRRSGDDNRDPAIAPGV